MTVLNRSPVLFVLNYQDGVGWVYIHGIVKVPDMSCSINIYVLLAASPPIYSSNDKLTFKKDQRMISERTLHRHSIIPSNFHKSVTKMRMRRYREVIVT